MPPVTNMSTTVLVSTFPPFPTLTLSVSTESSLTTVYELLADRYPSLPLHSDAVDLILTSPSGPVPQPHTALSSLTSAQEDGCSLISLRLVPRLRGGKGGFGSQLRAAGGRMSSQKTSNNDSCRDLSGRRLSTVREAKRLAEYIENEPQRKKAQQEAQRAKLEDLEKRLGITPGESSTSTDAAVGQKRRLEDTEYIEKSREIVDNVKSAVSAGLLKRRKKAKVSRSPPTEETPSAGPSGVAAEAEKVLDVTSTVLEAPATAVVVAAAAVTAAVVGVASA